MAPTLVYPARGRGAWNGRGVGGTFNAKGDGPGRYYRAPATGGQAIGLAGYRANRDNGTIGIDEYATYRATHAIQTVLKDAGYPTGSVDGIWGAVTDQAVRLFQTAHGLAADGIFGPVTARAMFEPLALAAAAMVDPENAAEVQQLMVGTITLESVWDPGAVGSSDSQDLGFGQINGPAHPTLSVNDRLNPKMSLPWVARLIDLNLRSFDYNIRDAAAAYNLGAGGARRWISQLRPDLYTPPGSTTPRNMRAYIDKVLAG